ncbi:MAG: hypothetical protein AMJ58_07635 [Gammaproteobacteria bacterium SG8_30]|nr:MAG: hypothetical protein AMJ58_07635 [Gammaproteobacteria bacterium SG8_30]
MRVQLVDRHGHDLLVGTGLVLHEQRADRPAADDGPGHHRHLADDDHVHGVAVLGQRVRHEAVVAGVVHRRVQEAVDAQDARLLVELVLHRHAPLRDLDQDVDVARRVLADRDLVDVHYWQAPVEWVSREP